MTSRDQKLQKSISDEVISRFGMGSGLSLREIKVMILRGESAFRYGKAGRSPLLAEKSKRVVDNSLLGLGNRGDV